MWSDEISFGKHGQWVHHIYKSTINAEWQVLEWHELRHRWLLFLKRDCIFQNDIPKTPNGFAVKEFGCWNGLAVSPDLSSSDNIWHLIRWKIQERRLKYQTRTFLSQKFSSCSPQLPDVYWLLFKEEGMSHSDKHGLVPILLLLSNSKWIFSHLKTVHVFSMFYYV